MANEYRVSTFANEILHAGVSNARFSTVAAEVLLDYPAQARFSTIALEVLRSTDSVVTPRRRMSLM